MTLRTLAEGAAARLRARDGGAPGPPAGRSAERPPDPAAVRPRQSGGTPCRSARWRVSGTPGRSGRWQSGGRPAGPPAGGSAEPSRRARPAVGRHRPAARHAWPALAGLVLGLLALGPGLAPGYLLSYDMVFVPRMPFSAALIGLTGGPPRAVPSDAVVAVGVAAAAGRHPAEADPAADLRHGLLRRRRAAGPRLAGRRPAAGPAGGRGLLRLESVRGRAAADRPVGAAARLRRAALGAAAALHRARADQARPGCCA